MVLAVYDGEPFLEQALSSVLRQSWRDFELIVVNDGSTDRSREIVAGVADPRIHLVDNERNLGLTPSLNRGIAAARGEFIARLDADDLATPDRLARQVAYLDTHPDVGLVGSWYRSVDLHGHLSDRRTPPSDHVALRWDLLFHCPFAHSSVMWRREPVAATAGAYDPRYRYAMDWEFWVRIAAHMRVANVARVLTHYRNQPQSMTSTSPRVAEETGMAREDALRSVFGEDAASWIGLGQTLYAPLDGWDEGAGERDIAASIDAILQLADAFAERLALDADARGAHRTRVRNWLAPRLMIRAYAAERSGRRGEGRAVFDAARALEPGVLFSVKAARYVAARLRRSLTVGAPAAR